MLTKGMDKFEVVHITHYLYRGWMVPMHVRLWRTVPATKLGLPYKHYYQSSSCRKHAGCCG